MGCVRAWHTGKRCEHGELRLSGRPPSPNPHIGMAESLAQGWKEEASLWSPQRQPCWQVAVAVMVVGGVGA